MSVVPSPSAADTGSGVSPTSPSIGLGPTGPYTPTTTAPISKDARPILIRRHDSIWSRIDQARDRLFEDLQRGAQVDGIEVLLVKSDEFVQPAQVQVECWMPRPDNPLVTERASACISIEARDFHRFSIVYTIALDARGRRSVIGPLRSFDAKDAAELMAYVLGHGLARPAFRSLQLRQRGWQLWRPKNAVDVFSPDLLASLPYLVGAAALVGWWYGGFKAFLLLVAAAFAVRYALAQRRIVVRSAGKPKGEPRTLIRVDSWQTVAPGLGDSIDTIRARFVASLPAHNGRLHTHLERNWNWGLEGVEEREQLVLAMGRALCFVHLYSYGSELYVGWDGQLNAGQWREKAIASGFDRSTGQLTEIRTVQNGVQQLTDYDVTDLNCLNEIVHAKLTTVVRHLAEERHLDLQLDFRIEQRGDRQGLTKKVDGGATGFVGKTARAIRRALRVE